MDKEWKKLEAIAAWQLDKVESKKEVFKEAQKNNNKVHFASLMDICHLKDAELEPQFRKCKGRVVLRGDIVKDVSGACAVFTEQGSSVSQMMAAKVVDATARLPDDGQAADANISPHPGKTGGCSKVAQKSEVRMSRCLDTSSKTQMAEIMG